jgi:hypothetical protein
LIDDIDVVHLHRTPPTQNSPTPPRAGKAVVCEAAGDQRTVQPVWLIRPPQRV